MTIQPLIIVTAKSSSEEWIEENVQNYLDAIARAGGDPHVLAPDSTADSHQRALSGTQGLLLSGGGDVHPRWYGQELSGSEQSSINPARDQLELDLTGRALEHNIPILAICRGMQVLNIVMGGQLLQDIDRHRSADRSTPCKHRVKLCSETRLCAILGGHDELLVNSHHHQAISEQALAPGLVVAAHSLPDSDIIEAAESGDHNWVTAVQWHPEKTGEVTSEQGNLFAEFVLQATSFSLAAAA